MLVCNVSLRASRRTIAADVAEAATASDTATTGYVVFATLVDDPASVNDVVDAYLGEIMLEAASAVADADAGLVYAAAVNEATTATDVQDAASTPAVGSAPTIDGSSVTGIKSGGGALTTAPLTTSAANDIIVIVSSVEGNGVTTPNVTSVTGGGLTFALRSRNNLDTGGASTGRSSAEVWWALAPSPLSGVVFTINYAATYDDAAAIAFGVSGCSNTSAPWDTNGSLPNIGASSSVVTFTGVSTTNTFNLLLMVLANPIAQSYTEPTGWTLVGNIVNNGGARWAWAHASSQAVSAPVSGATYTSSPIGTFTAGIVDALSG